MTASRACALAAVLVLAPAALAAQQRTLPPIPERPTVTLAEAIQLARANLPSVVRAQADLKNAGATQRSAFGNWLPTLSLGANGTRSFQEGESRVDLVTGNVVPGDRTTNNANTSLSASWDIFTGFRRGAESRAADATMLAAEAGLIDAEAQVTLETTQEYLNALSARELVGVRLASVTRAEEQLKVSVAKLQQGSATRSDSLRSFVQVGQAQVQVLEALASLAAAEANLGRLIGVDGRVAAVDEPALQSVVTVIDTAALRAEARSQAPAVQSAEAEVTSAEANLATARSSYWPTLSLNGNLGYSGGAEAGESINLNQSRSVGIRASWNIFNGFERETQVVQRSTAVDVAEATARDAARQVDASLTARLAELHAARMGIEITRASVVAAEEDTRVQQERYRLGAATIVDVLTSQETLNQAEVDVVNARFAYLRAKAQIEALIGRSL